MIQKDYILRMLEMLAEMLASILNYIKKGEFEKAYTALENAYQTLLKEDSFFFQNIPIEKLTDELIQEHHYTNSHLEILSELFYAEAELQFAKGNKNESLVLYLKSSILFEFLEKATKLFSTERQAKKKSIYKRIAEIKGNKG